MTIIKMLNKYDLIRFLISGSFLLYIVCSAPSGPIDEAAVNRALASSSFVKLSK